MLPGTSNLSWDLLRLVRPLARVETGRRRAREARFSSSPWSQCWLPSTSIKTMCCRCLDKLPVSCDKWWPLHLPEPAPPPLHPFPWTRTWCSNQSRRKRQSCAKPSRQPTPSAALLLLLTVEYTFPLFVNYSGENEAICSWWKES